jgi:hypothetical protein
MEDALVLRVIIVILFCTLGRGESVNRYYNTCSYSKQLGLLCRLHLLGWPGKMGLITNTKH